MIAISSATKIYFCRTPVNLHKSFDGLPGLVREYLNGDPLSGHLFLFFNRRRTMIKMIYWEGDGFAIWSKRLERGQFNLPQSTIDKIQLNSGEFHALLGGVKPKRYYKRYSNNSSIN